jgi:peptide/nickel transport system substrate-binding protein/oligopeptide transport system substrate-binding protein
MAHRVPRRALPSLLLLALAAGCPAPSERPTTTGAEGAQPKSTAAAKQQPPADGWFRYRLREDPPELDPAKSTDIQSAAVVLRVFDGLVEFEPVTLEVRPCLATSWTISPDRLVYEFTMRPGLTFHDGSPVTAEDVVYSWNRVFRTDVNSERRWVLEPIKGSKDVEDGKAKTLAGLDVVAPDRLRVTLERPYAPFLGQLCMEAASVVPRSVYDDPTHAYARKPVGAGPFEFVEWQQGNFITVKAFEHHWKGKPKLAGIRYRFIADMSTALEEYKNGGLELVDEIAPGQRQVLAKDLPGEYHRWPQLGSLGFAFNHQLPPFKGNVKLRQAFNYAVDRKYICEKVQEGKDAPAYGWIPAGLPGHRPEADVDPYDPVKAKQLLAEAGYPEGKGLAPVVLWTNTREDYLRIAQRIQHDLAEIGVTIEIQNLDWASYLQFVQATPTENTTATFFRQGWVADYPDADNFLTINLSCDTWGPAGNYSRYCNPEFEKLIDEAREESDQAKRTALYQQADKLATDDASMLYIFFYGEDALVKPYVKGFAYSPQGDYTAPMEEVSFDASAAGS